MTVAPLPEVDALAADLADALRAATTEGDRVEYLGGEGVEPCHVADLFHHAANLFRAAPWKGLGDPDLIRVDVPHLERTGLCVSVIGVAEEALGWIAFDSIAEYKRFASNAERGTPVAAGALALTYMQASEVPEIAEEARDLREFKTSARAADLPTLGHLPWFDNDEISIDTRRASGHGQRAVSRFRRGGEAVGNGWKHTCVLK